MVETDKVLFSSKKMSTASTLDSLKNGSNLPGDSKSSSDEKPVWYDHGKFTRGQTFFKRHVAAIGYSMHLSLVSGFSIVNLLDPLVFTEASDTPEKALKRYVMTFYHIFLWMTGDVWDKSSKTYKSLKTVRGMHSHVAKRMKSKHPDQTYVSQYDMGLVQSGFFAAAMMYPERFGIHCTKEELDDYVFTWRVIGYLLGIKDEYNICSGGYEESFTICKDIERQILLPALENPPKNFDLMADAYTHGINIPLVIKIHSKLSVLALVWDGFGYPIPFKLSVTDWIRFYFWQIYFFALYWLPGFEKLLNWQILRSLVKNIETLFGTDIKADLEKYVQELK